MSSVAGSPRIWLVAGGFDRQNGAIFPLIHSPDHQSNPQNRENHPPRYPYRPPRAFRGVMSFLERRAAAYTDSVADDFPDFGDWIDDPGYA